jgi:hypothetical protein
MELHFNVELILTNTNELKNKFLMPDKLMGQRASSRGADRRCGENFLKLSSLILEIFHLFLFN